MNTFTVILITTFVLALAIQWWKHRALRKETSNRHAAETDGLKAALQTCREERNNLLNALSDAFLLVDESETIVFTNTAAHALLGSRPLLHRSIREAFLDTRLAHVVVKCLETSAPVTKRIVFPQQTSPLGDSENRGENAWIIDASPLLSSTRQTAVTRIVIRDVTAEHQTEQVRKDFVANASHELRTPLAIIGGYLENLLDENMLEDPALTRRFLTIMRKHSDRLSRIVEDMLLISRLESGEPAALKVEPFRFRSCINDVLERLEALIRERNAVVSAIMDDEETTLEGDRFYWTQTLFNLVENALKQNPFPGLKILISCQNAGEGMLRINVVDNGIGIPAADLPHVFRRFYRVEKHHSQKEIKGTGLGLSIVKRAITAHHGTISLTSLPGRETKFTILVPQIFPNPKEP